MIVLKIFTTLKGKFINWKTTVYNPVINFFVAFPGKPQDDAYIKRNNDIHIGLIHEIKQFW